MSRSDAAIAHSERAKIAVIEHSRRDKMASIDHHKIRSVTAPAGERGQFWSTNIDAQIHWRGNKWNTVRVFSRRRDVPSTWRNLMRKQLSTTVFASLFLALTGGLAVGHTPPPAAGLSSVIKVAKQTTAPPRISATGRTHRSRTASTKGANARGFCPPGQRKKPGKGSAFHC